MCVVNTHQPIMFFTNTGRVYTMKCYQIPEAGRQARGTAIINLLQITAGEKISTMLPMPREGGDYNLVMATRSGIIKKTELNEFRNLRRSGLIAIALREEDELIGVRLTTGEDELMISSRKGMAIRFNERHVRTQGRNSMGVRSMRLREGDEIIDISVVEPDTDVLAITSGGYGKRTSPDEYREQGRNGKGIRAMNLTDKTGDLAALFFVREGEDILMITDDGTIIRARTEDIRRCSRYTQGVRIMRLIGEAKVVGVCRAEREEDAEEEIVKPETEMEETESTEPVEEPIDAEVAEDAEEDFPVLEDSEDAPVSDDEE